MTEFYVNENDVIEQAISIVNSRFYSNKNEFIKDAHTAIKYASLKLRLEKREVFSALLLTKQHQVIKYIEFFYGTIDSCTVYPREVVKACLENNAGSIIFMHNHPSGVAEPSLADKKITKDLSDILNVIDVNVLDHIVVAGNEDVSFAEQGLL